MKLRITVIFLCIFFFNSCSLVSNNVMSFFTAEEQQTSTESCCDLINNISLSGISVINNLQDNEYMIFTDYDSVFGLDKVKIELRMKKNASVSGLEYCIYMDDERGDILTYDSSSNIFIAEEKLSKFENITELSVRCNNKHKIRIPFREVKLKDCVQGTVEDYVTKSYYNDIYFINREPEISETIDGVEYEFLLYNPSFKTFEPYINIAWDDVYSNEYIEIADESVEVDFNYVSICVRIPYMLYEHYKDRNNCRMIIGMESKNLQVTLDDLNSYFVRSVRVEIK